MRSSYFRMGKSGNPDSLWKMCRIRFPGTMTNSSMAIKWNEKAMPNVADHIALISGWLLSLFCCCPVHYYLSLNCYRCKCTHDIKMKYYLIQLAFGRGQSAVHLICWQRNCLQTNKSWLATMTHAKFALSLFVSLCRCAHHVMPPHKCSTRKIIESRFEFERRS